MPLGTVNLMRDRNPINSAFRFTGRRPAGSRWRAFSLLQFGGDEYNQRRNYESYQTNSVRVIEPDLWSRRRWWPW